MSVNSQDVSAAESILSRSDADGVTTLTLNRPQQFNCLSEQLLQALLDELDRIARDDSVRVVIVAATGKAFCAGHDLKQMRARPDQDYYQNLFNQCGRMMLAINRLPVPVIARVQGIATAAGCQLVAACDLAVAADSARFAVSGINVGLFCATPAVALSRNVGRKQAMEMLLTGEFISAARALELGLVNRVATAEHLDRTLQELVDAIVAKPAVAVRTGKQMFYRQLEMPMEDAYLYAGDVMACNMMADDTGEGIDAFMEKRKPRWHGC